VTTSTRIIYADTPKELLPICKAVGYIRADIWRRYGGLKTARKTTNDIRINRSLIIDRTSHLLYNLRGIANETKGCNVLRLSRKSDLQGSGSVVPSLSATTKDGKC